MIYFFNFFNSLKTAFLESIPVRADGGGRQDDARNSSRTHRGKAKDQSVITALAFFPDTNREVVKCPVLDCRRTPHPVSSTEPFAK